MVEVASKADIGYQDELWIGRGTGSVTWTQILGITELSAPQKVPEDIDVTHMQSPGRSRETIPGMLAVGDWSQDIQYWPGELHDVLLEELAAKSETGDRELVQIEFKFLGGARRTYSGYVNEYTPQASVGDVRTVTLGLKLFDRIASARPLPPTITGVPTISGTTTQGQTLTATAATVTGTGPITRTWQWNRNGSPIGSATNATYVLVAGDVGTVITVTQTETNAQGAASATSAPTASIAGS
jgi:hypothetical protein